MNWIISTHIFAALFLTFLVMYIKERINHKKLIDKYTIKPRKGEKQKNHDPVYGC